MKRRLTICLFVALTASACGGNTPEPRTVYSAACRAGRAICRAVDAACPAQGASAGGSDATP